MGLWRLNPGQLCTRQSPVLYYGSGRKCFHEFNRFLPAGLEARGVPALGRVECTEVPAETTAARDSPAPHSRGVLDTPKSLFTPGGPHVHPAGSAPTVGSMRQAAHPWVSPYITQGTPAVHHASLRTSFLTAT